MYSPLDLERLAVRIETLQRKNLHDFDGGDQLEFRQALPASDPSASLRPGVLPNPVYLRLMAARMTNKDEVSGAEMQRLNAACRQGISVAMRLESLVHKNAPGSPQRLLRDMRMGKVRF